MLRSEPVKIVRAEARQRPESNYSGQSARTGQDWTAAQTGGAWANCGPISSTALAVSGAGAICAGVPSQLNLTHGY
jgi:hypothetical protein